MTLFFKYLLHKNENTFPALPQPVLSQMFIQQVSIQTFTGAYLPHRQLPSETFNRTTNLCR